MFHSSKGISVLCQRCIDRKTLSILIDKHLKHLLHAVFRAISLEDDIPMNIRDVENLLFVLTGIRAEHIGSYDSYDFCFVRRGNAGLIFDVVSRETLPIFIRCTVKSP